jgi:hypothetical protein
MAQHTPKNTMSTVNVQLGPDTEKRLREKANRRGLTLEAYLQQLAEHDATGLNGAGQATAAEPDLSDEEFERLLDELSDGPPLPHLPANFSRADIYADHD